MKRQLLLGLLISLSLVFSGCSWGSPVPSGPEANRADQLPETPSGDIALLFEALGNALEQDVSTQRTALMWQQGSTRQLYEGYRIRFQNVPAASFAADSFLEEQGFTSIADGESSSDEGWTKQFQKGQVLCSLQQIKRNGNEDYLVSCASKQR